MKHDYMNTNVYFENLPATVTHTELMKLFSVHAMWWTFIFSSMTPAPGHGAIMTSAFEPHG